MLFWNLSGSYIVALLELSWFIMEFLMESFWNLCHVAEAIESEPVDSERAGGGPTATRTADVSAAGAIHSQPVEGLRPIGQPM